MTAPKKIVYRNGRAWTLSKVRREDAEVEDLTDPGTMIQLGVAPVRIDLMTQLSGVSNFADVWRRRVEGGFGSVRGSFMSLDDLITAKEAADRLQDRADVRILKKARERCQEKPRRKK